MPISADRFETIEDDEGPSPGTNAYEILAFLREHADKAFTQSEIVEATGVAAGSVGPTLVRLRDHGRVDHRGTYWRISDHERSVDAATGHGAASAERNEDDAFQYDEWRSYAVDPRETRDKRE